MDQERLRSWKLQRLHPRIDPRVPSVARLDMQLPVARSTCTRSACEDGRRVDKYLHCLAICVEERT